MDSGGSHALVKVGLKDENNTLVNLPANCTVKVVFNESIGFAVGSHCVCVHTTGLKNLLEWRNALILW